MTVNSILCNVDVCFHGGTVSHQVATFVKVIAMPRRCDQTKQENNRMKIKSIQINRTSPRHIDTAFETARDYMSLDVSAVRQIK